jgi:hypothetical protein
MTPTNKYRTALEQIATYKNYSSAELLDLQMTVYILKDIAKTALAEDQDAAELVLPEEPM